MLTRKERQALLLRRIYSDNGFSYFRMSRFEEYDFYADKKDFLTSKNILTFTDADGRLMALRPDVTLSLIKNAGEGKYHYSETVYRVPKNSSSFREISQSGLEIIGEIGGSEIKEVIRLALLSLETLSEGKKFVLAVADAGQIRRLLGRVDKRLALKYMSQKNIHGLKEIGASQNLIVLAGLDGSIEKSLVYLADETAEIISSIPNDNIRIDYSVAENLMYYDGIIFKGYIEGVPEAVLSGGKYRIMNKSGVGFAVYLDFIERNNDDKYCAS